MHEKDRFVFVILYEWLWLVISKLTLFLNGPLLTIKPRQTDTSRSRVQFCNHICRTSNVTSKFYRSPTQEIRISSHFKLKFGSCMPIKIFSIISYICVRLTKIDYMLRILTNINKLVVDANQSFSSNKKHTYVLMPNQECR